MNHKNNKNYLKIILQLILLSVIAVAPTYFAITNGGAKFEFTTPVLFTLSFLGIFLVASAFSLCGYVFEFEIKNECSTTKQYAPIYTKEERIKHFIKHAIWAVPLFLIAQFWFFPFLDDYSKIAHCKKYGSITGTHILLYGVFVVLPVSLALIALLIAGKRNVLIIKLGQDPLPNEKVLSQTEYTNGFKAKFHAYIFFLFILLAFGFAVQGNYVASEIVKDVGERKSTQVCNKT